MELQQKVILNSYRSVFTGRLTSCRKWGRQQAQRTPPARENPGYQEVSYTRVSDRSGAQSVSEEHRFPSSVSQKCPTELPHQSVQWKCFARKLFSVPTCAYLDDVKCLNHVVYFHLVFSIQLCGFYQSIFSMPFSWCAATLFGVHHSKKKSRNLDHQAEGGQLLCFLWREILRGWWEAPADGGQR